MLTCPMSQLLQSPNLSNAHVTPRSLQAQLSLTPPWPPPLPSPAQNDTHPHCVYSCLTPAPRTAACTSLIAHTLSHIVIVTHHTPTPQQIQPALLLNADAQQFPLIAFEEFWLLRDKLVPMNDTVEEVVLQLSVKPQKLWWWQIQQQVGACWRVFLSVRLQCVDLGCVPCAVSMPACPTASFRALPCTTHTTRVVINILCVLCCAVLCYVLCYVLCHDSCRRGVDRWSSRSRCRSTWASLKMASLTR